MAEVIEKVVTNAGWEITGKFELARPVCRAYAFSPELDPNLPLGPSFTVVVNTRAVDGDQNHKREIAAALAVNVCKVKVLLGNWDQNAVYEYDYPHAGSRNWTLEAVASILLNAMARQYELGFGVDIDAQAFALERGIPEQAANRVIDHLIQTGQIELRTFGGEYHVTPSAYENSRNRPRALGLQLEITLSKTVDRLEALSPGLGVAFEAHVNEATLPDSGGLDGTGFANSTRVIFERITDVIIRVIDPDTDIESRQTQRKAKRIIELAESESRGAHMMSIAAVLDDETVGFNRWLMRSLHEHGDSLAKFATYQILLVSDWLDVLDSWKGAN